MFIAKVMAHHLLCFGSSRTTIDRTRGGGTRATSGIDCSKTEPIKTHVANTGPRIILLIPNGMFGVLDLELMAAKQNP